MSQSVPVLFLVLATAASAQQKKTLNADVIVYGGNPSGLAAAEAVIRAGSTAIVVEPTSHIGGMVTGGIAITDTATPQFVGGIAAEFFDEVAAQTHKEHPNPPQPMLVFKGREMPWRAPANWDLEPKTARRVFDGWVRRGGYKLILNRRVLRVSTDRQRIQSIVLTDGSELSGKVFVDASYEGDLLARAGVSNTNGRESAAQYGESLAGIRTPHFVKNYSEDVYDTPGLEYMHHGQFGADIPAWKAHGKLLWGVESGPLGEVGGVYKRLQSYCYRLIATERKDLKVPWPQPRHYDPEHYELVLRYIQAHPGICFARLVHLGAIPNGKFDLNASGPFSIDFVGGNSGFPDASYAQRDKTLEEHQDYEKGFLWFLSHDKRMPQTLHDDANSWDRGR